MNGLQREADQDQANSEDTHALLGHTVCAPFDERREWDRDRRNYTDHQPGFQPDAQRIRALVANQGADVSGNGVANRAIQYGEKMKFSETRAGGGVIINRWPNASAVRKGLSHGAQCAECGSECASI